MDTRASLTIRLHPNDDVVIARAQLVGGTTLIDENVTVAGLVPPGHKVGGARHRRRAAGQALQPGDRLCQPRHRGRRAVHLHNLRMGALELDYAFGPTRSRRTRGGAGDLPGHRPRRRPRRHAHYSASCRRSTARRRSRAASPTRLAAARWRSFPTSTAWSR